MSAAPDRAAAAVRQPQSAGDARRAIVVLTPGRSGSSLLMQVLERLGMALSEDLIPGRYENPDGFFEDAEIVEEHKRLMTELRAVARLPLPRDWIASRAAKKAKPRLQGLLNQRLQGSERLWGFKDPRTAAFLPLWLQVLNGERVTPSFVLALRDPAAVAASLRRIEGQDESTAELLWLYRTSEALHHTAADCFIVHYEDWFTRGAELAHELLVFTGLDEAFQGGEAEALKSVVKHNLNRSIYEDYDVRNCYVRKLYDTLRDCRGSDFDRAALMQVVRECRAAMDGFRGWSDLAQHCVQAAKTADHADHEAPSAERDRWRCDIERRLDRLERQLERRD